MTFLYTKSKFAFIIEISKIDFKKFILKADSCFRCTISYMFVILATNLNYLNDVFICTYFHDSMVYMSVYFSIEGI